MAKKGSLISVFDSVLNRTRCYCAFCKSERTIYKKKSVSAVNFAVSFLGAVSIMYVLFREIHPMGLIIWAVFALVSELFVSMRWRISMVCKNCGFDPILYLKEPEKAAVKVKLKLDERKARPETILANPLKLPTISKHRKEVLEKSKKTQKGSMISRQV